MEEEIVLRKKDFIEFRRTEDNSAVRRLFPDDKFTEEMKSVKLTMNGRPMMINTMIGTYDGIVSERGAFDEPLTPLGKALDESLFRRRIFAGEDPIESDQLVEAAKTGNIELFQTLLAQVRKLATTGCNAEEQKKEKELVQQALSPSNGTWSALTWSSHLDHRYIAVQLVEAGVNVDYEDEKGWTALMWAAHQNNFEIASCLLSCGASVDHQNEYGTTALMWAARQGHLRTTKLLIEHGANTNHKNNEQSTALILACRGGYLDVARLLLQHGADGNACNVASESPVLCATQAGHIHVVIELISRGCDVLVENKYGQDVLGLAALLPEGKIQKDLIALLSDARQQQLLLRRQKGVKK